MDYEQRLQHFYESFLRPGMVAVDVGAHVGRHAREMIRLVKPSGFVWLFEPIPALYEELRRSLGSEAETAECCAVHKFAISDANGATQFCIAVDALGFSGLLERQYDYPTRIERIDVQTRTLDSVLPTASVDYIKIDTEGAEWSVLRGARSLVQRSRPIISFEFGEASFRNYQVDPREVFSFFETSSYVIVDILGRPLDDATAFFESSLRQEVWDYIAAPREKEQVFVSLTAAS